MSYILGPGNPGGYVQMNQLPVNMDHEDFQDILILGPECRERFLITEEIPELRDHDMHMGGVSWLRGHYHVGRKDPDIHTLLFTLGGGGQVRLPGRSEMITPGSVTLLPAHQPFLFELGAAEQEWRMAWLLLDDSEVWSALRGQPADVFQHDQVWAISPMMDALYHQIKTPRRRRMVGLISEMLTDLLLRESGYSRLEMTVRQLYAQLEDQLHHPWSQARLAERVHCSVPHLNRVCKKLYGQGPMSRLADLRLQRAGELLASSNWQVSQIAQRVGYADAFNFSHWFRGRTGMSPTQFRRYSRRRSSQYEA